MKTDAQVIDICRHLHFIEREEAELLEHDKYAPEEHSPNCARHRVLLAERAALLAALARAQPPRTRQGVQALAEVAMIYLDAERSPEDHRFAPEDIVQWLALIGLSCAAGRHETIKLPQNLPIYWPA